MNGKPHATIPLVYAGKDAVVLIHRYGCSECGHGIKRVVIEVPDQRVSTELLGAAARAMWNMAEYYDEARQ